MTCTSITVNPTPNLIGIIDHGFASITGCTTKCAAVAGKIVRVTVKCTALVTLTCNVDIQYNKPDGSVQGWSHTGVAWTTGTIEKCFSNDVYAYVVGTYTNLKVTLSNVVAT